MHLDVLVFTLFFTGKRPLKNLSDVKTCDVKAFAEYFKFMLEKGFYLSPSQFELNFVSAAHSEKELAAMADATLEFLEHQTKARPNTD